MYKIVLFILYLIIIIPSLTRLIRYRDFPAQRRLSAGIGVGLTLLAPTAASYICELLVSIFSIGLFIVIVLGGLGMILRSLFRFR